MVLGSHFKASADDAIGKRQKVVLTMMSRANSPQNKLQYSIHHMKCKFEAQRKLRGCLDRNTQLQCQHSQLQIHSRRCTTQDRLNHNQNLHVFDISLKLTGISIPISTETWIASAKQFYVW